ncbi:hypothetical protein GCWU000282_00477 [Catonella morbi ATCC 51271]|uniref:SCP2 domain-containing protein n=1 Tax=Catonella morbi ATCC 51271 TaxID=592026 RepID=V2ZB44_9FIRM|nr:SCP2 sterol-binding domain-containing protein [Catonella morbi]ESL04130.1 hypothetical protein GCWU000282_00477 [Catonella morbi ATCC 51271]
MNINIYYGGRGLIEDPTIYVCDKITEVLTELRVQVKRYNLFEEKNSISMLPKTLKEADGIILASSLEWFGIGGYMLQFLDACWLYGDKSKIAGLFMMPVVTSTAFGEDESYLSLIRAWKILGGNTCQGISAYVEDHTEFELNGHYARRIERIAEDLYRAVNQNLTVFPSSEFTIRSNTAIGSNLPLTPQESEQLSVYVSNDNYVKKQKEDIEELSQMFREMLGNDGTDQNDLIKQFRNHFKPQEGFKATYSIEMSDLSRTIIIEAKENELKCYYGELKETDVASRTTGEVLNDIVAGKTTFQKAFMSGALAAKGNFKTLRMFDTIFQFAKE